MEDMDIFKRVNMPVDVLFLCPHHAAKSVIAAAYFNQIAQEKGLMMTADSAGTEPSEAVMPIVVSLLANEGIDVSRHQPRYVTMAELQSARRVISMGCTAEELGMSETRIEAWDDVPAVSLNPEQARNAIQVRVEQLMDQLKNEK